MRETKRQQQQMVRVMGSTHGALCRFRDQLQADVRDQLSNVGCYPGGSGWVTLQDALEEALRRVGAAEGSRVHDLLRRWNS